MESTISFDAVTALLLLAVAVMGSPGPTTVSLVGVSASFGARRALPYMVGEILGTTVVLIAVAGGVTAALMRVPALASVLGVVSAAYILWLAFKIATAPPPSADSDVESTPSLFGGFLLGVANPKAWVALGAVFASVSIADSPTVDGLTKLVILTGMIVLVHLAWLLAGAAFARLLRHERAGRVVNVVLALSLLAAAATALRP